MLEKSVASMLAQVKEFVRNESPRPLVGGSSAWISATLRAHPETWIHTLSTDEIAEIEAAVAAVMTEGVDVADITRRNFPLPRFGHTLDALCREILDGRGSC